MPARVVLAGALVGVLVLGVLALFAVVVPTMSVVHDAAHDPQFELAPASSPDDTPAVGSSHRPGRSAIALLGAIVAVALVAAPVVRTRRARIPDDAPPWTPARAGGIGLRAPPALI